jgi:hypothetical protein
MLNRLLGKQLFAGRFWRRHTRLERWSNDIIEQERAINEERKTKNLKPLE